ncbi:MAG: hypothetical protein OXJ56_18595, partial [Rhodospirillaceae bacterium]|nr:hypothetical protein [Rhodospirillaceae bacterium]
NVHIERIMQPPYFVRSGRDLVDFLGREAVQERPSEHYALPDPDRTYVNATGGKRRSSFICIVAAG